MPYNRRHGIRFQRVGAETVVHFLLVLLVEYGLTFPSLMSRLFQVGDEGYVADEGGRGRAAGARQSLEQRD
jgi:hypothetical protein